MDHPINYVIISRNGPGIVQSVPEKPTADGAIPLGTSGKKSKVCCINSDPPCKLSSIVVSKQVFHANLLTRYLDTKLGYTLGYSYNPILNSSLPVS